MPTDPRDTFPVPTPPPLPAGWKAQQPQQQEPQLASLPSLAGGGSLGNSLAQSARLKQLKVARGIMFVLGVLFIVVNALQYKLAIDMVDRQIDQEVTNAQRQGAIVDLDEVREIKASAHRFIQLMLGGCIAIGIMYIVFGFIVNKFPVPITIIALVVYIGYVVVLGVLDPKTLPQGFILKAIVIVALAKAVQAAIAYQTAKKEAEFSNAGFAE